MRPSLVLGGFALGCGGGGFAFAVVGEYGAAAALLFISAAASIAALIAYTREGPR